MPRLIIRRKSLDEFAGKGCDAGAARNFHGEYARANYRETGIPSTF
tara:strand:+ start:1040 stop:1177 length:138 start_codon:yes stop_codon:yes gene_type:complete